jgi:hypothetical protein
MIYMQVGHHPSPGDHHPHSLGGICKRRSRGTRACRPYNSAHRGMCVCVCEREREREREREYVCVCIVYRVGRELIYIYVYIYIYIYIYV